jgi:hypothetical protein
MALVLLETSRDYLSSLNSLTISSTLNPLRLSAWKSMREVSLSPKRGPLRPVLVKHLAVQVHLRGRFYSHRFEPPAS